MNWVKFIFRTISAAVLICSILYWAEQTVPMGSVLVLLLLISFVITWVVINILNDDDALANIFDDLK